MTRFVHFMPVDSPIFNSEFIKLISEIPNIGEHIFVIGGKGTLKCLEGTSYNNVRYEPRQRLAAVRRYGREADVIVLHSLALRTSEVSRMGSKLARKIVWCIWGHDLYAPREPKSLYSRLRRWLADRRIREFRAIVAGFKYDEVLIRKLFGTRIPVYNALYASGYFQNDVDRIVQNHTRTDSRLNIQVGHSGYQFLQHEKQLDRLAAYKEKQIVITLIFSYGEKEYIDRVTQYAIDIFGEDKVRIIREFLGWEEYIDLLCDVDIAVFDYERQAAFGNLILLSSLGKKLYLSPTGIMSQAFRAEGIDTFVCSEIGSISFETFSKKSETAGTHPYIESLLDKEKIKHQWEQLFRTLQ